jgi:hypothetical protein
VTILATATLGSGAGFNYQWYRTGVGALSNGADYGNVTTAVLQVKTANFASGQYDYFCIVTDKGCAGSTTSGTSSLYISQSPILTGISDVDIPLAPAECWPFGSGTTATGGAGNYQFMWYHDGVAFDAGQVSDNTSALAFPNGCSYGGQWYCKVTDGAGCTAQTNAARLRFVCNDGVHYCNASTSCP